jgi:hypothetical protein|tara:strand:+ start:37 stop:552 length:516 start_codon:yes stop_codon:yes gene_type:complete
MFTQKQLVPKIAGVRKSTKAIRANIQEILVHAAGIAYQHGNVSSFTNLINSTRGADQKAIMSWIRDNGFAIYKVETGVYNLNKTMQKREDFVDGDAVVAYLTNEVPAWYELQATTETIARELDVNKRLESLIKSMREGKNVVKVDFMAARQLMDVLQHEMAEVDRKTQIAH